jgi:hypothetical protein
VASGYGLKPDQSASGELKAHLSSHREAIVRFWRNLILDVFGPYFIGYVPAARDPVASSLQMLTPVAFAQGPGLTELLMRAAPLQVLHSSRHRQTGRYRQQQMHAVLKKLADAWQPLYQTLSPDQKRRMALLTIFTIREMRNAVEQRRLQSEDDDED